MDNIRIKLDTSDFTVWRQPDGRIGVQIGDHEHTVTFDLHEGVAQDLMVQLVDPDPED